MRAVLGFGLLMRRGWRVRESEVLRSIRDVLNTGPVRLFRNNVGTALVVNHKHGQTKQAIISACARLAESRGAFAQRMSFGLSAGSGDLIGYRQVVIGPEHVGMTRAQFLSVEVKADKGRVRPEQVNWLEHINQAGGLAVVARSLEVAKQLLTTPFSADTVGSQTGD